MSPSTSRASTPALSVVGVAVEAFETNVFQVTQGELQGDRGARPPNISRRKDLANVPETPFVEGFDHPVGESNLQFIWRWKRGHHGSTGH